MEEKIFYNSDNNIKLCGILNKSNNDKIVIMCHGIRGNKDEQQLVYFADRLQKEGYSSFRFDFNGHGEIDSAVPYKLSKSVAEMCNNSRFELIENGEHTFQNSKEAIEKAVDITVNFIKDIL